MNSADPSRVEWDVIVVGTGIGGATLGHALARAGRRVLFCERGRNHLAAGATALVGNYPEELALQSGTGSAGASDMLARGGRFADEVIDESGPRPLRWVPFVGSGSGGSSALYGMALERYSAADFEPGTKHPDAAGSTRVESWPITYGAMQAYYASAEALYRVRGEAEVGGTGAAGVTSPRYIGSPAPLTQAAAELFAYFESRGLHPYRLPLACEFVPGCACCQGYLCAKACKNDSARICLAPAVQDSGAVLLDECQVLRIDADRRRATGVVCRWKGADLVLRGRQIVLAAGALQTPNILLRSHSALWPGGLANRSGMVGRNLMRHCVDLYLVRPEHDAASGNFDNRFKEFGFNDFQSSGGVGLGAVQSFGRLPPARMLHRSLVQEVRDGRVPWLAAPAALAAPVLLPALRRMVEHSLTLATIMEDLPYLDNRIWPAADGPPASVRMSYRLRSTELARVALFRRLMKTALKSRRWRLLKQAENNQRIAHACGTCRFGHDPRTSVLDANNRCHGMDNLYVVDASFFPSSGATNPSLTIAANALRVADHMMGVDAHGA